MLISFGITIYHPTNEESYKIQKYFESRALIVQGGCAEDNKFHGDLYRFVFKTCKWEKIVTFAFDYYNISQKPDEDEEVKTLSPENQVAEPQLKEAELRCCHHTAVYYRNEERDYLFIIGGVKIVICVFMTPSRIRVTNLMFQGLLLCN